MVVDAEFLVAILGLIVSVILATIGYIWQKSKDRALSIELEKLRIYSNYLAAMGRYYQACLLRKTAGKDAAWKAYIDTHIPAAEMLVYVDEQIAFVARRWIEGIKAYQNATYDYDDEKEANVEVWRARRNKARDLATNARREFLSLVRADLLKCSTEASMRTIRAYHGSDTESLLDIEYDGLTRKLTK